MFPWLNAEQAGLLCEYYADNIADVVDALMTGLSHSDLLNQFRNVRLIPGMQHIVVRKDHIVEDGLRCLYKGNFNVCQAVCVEILESPATDLGGVACQFFTEFLRIFPSKFNKRQTKGYFSES